MKKRFSEEQIIGFLYEAEAGLGQGAVPAAWLFVYLWRSKYGGLDVSDEPQRAIGGLLVTRFLDRLATIRGLPQVIRTDNGKEFCGQPC